MAVLHHITVTTITTIKEAVVSFLATNIINIIIIIIKQFFLLITIIIARFLTGIEDTTEVLVVESLFIDRITMDVVVVAFR